MAFDDYYEEPDYYLDDDPDEDHMEEMINGEDDICRECDGDGTVNGHLCKSCQGSGHLEN